MPTYESREAFESVIVRLLELTATDPAFVRASKDKSFVLSMVFPDLETGFHSILRDGKVVGSLGRPPEPPTIEVKMSSQVFDDMFTGRLNPMRASVRGDLSFTGSKLAGLRFQGLVPDFTRLYKQAKSEKA